MIISQCQMSFGLNVVSYWYDILLHFFSYSYILENDSEWVDIVEKELRHILEPKLLELSLRSSSHGITRSTVSGSISSITPPLPPLSGGDNLSPTMTPNSVGNFKG